MKKPRAINYHHLVYGSPEHPEQEWKLPIFKGEHEIATKMQLYSRKTVSLEFLMWLDYFKLRNWRRAVPLSKEDRKMVCGR
jgi:hypothetical protein